MTSVDIDLGSYKLYIDGVQVNKTPQVVKPRETNKKSKHPVILKIIVGPNCNSNCKYCCQIGKNKSEPLKIEELLDRLDSTVEYDKLHEIQLYGGEPLLYFENIVKICEHFKKLKVFKSIITNGKLLNKEIINILNIYDVHVSLSHDGPGQTRNRGEDPLELNRDVIKDIKHLSIACCLTKDNFDICEINDWFYNKFKDIGVNPRETMINYYEVEIHNEGMVKFAITDLAKYQICLRMFFERCKANDPTIIWNSLYHNITEGSVSKFCNDIVKSEPIFDCTVCCMEFEEVLIVDYNGYIRECQNLDDTYNIGVLEDLPNKMYVRSIKCKDCLYRNICKSVCPIIPDKFFNINCSMMMARYEVVADFGLKIITKEVTDIASNNKY